MAAVFVAAIAADASAYYSGTGPRTVYNQDAFDQEGEGSLLFNQRGAYYMGRLWNDDRFDVYEEVNASNGARYRWGRPIGRAGEACFWIGPESASPANLTEYLRDDGGAHQLSNCSSGQKESLADDARRFGSSFNCPDGWATGPQLSSTSAEAQFYYNVTWTVTGSGTTRVYTPASLPQSNPSGIGQLTVPAGTPIKYRFTSGGYAVVFHHDYGWGFMPASAVRKVSGRFGGDQADTEAQCNADRDKTYNMTYTDWPNVPDDGLVRSAGQYFVWRSGGQAESVNVAQAAQQFKPAEAYIRSASLNIGTSPDGRVTIGIYSDAAQTQLVGQKTVAVKLNGETTATFERPLPVSPNVTYYLRATSPTGGNLQIYRSKYNDYAAGSAQYNGGTFNGLDLNSRVVTSSDATREHYSLNRTADQAAVVQVSKLTQQFTANVPKLTSVSARLGTPSSGSFYMSVYSDAALTQLVPGGQKLVPVNAGGMTTATFDTPLDVTVGAKYYFKVVASTGETFAIIRSAGDDYPYGGANYSDETGYASPDMIARITGSIDTAADTYWVWRTGAEASPLTVPQAAQQFRATNSTVKSVSVNIGSAPNGQIGLRIFRDKAQTDLVAGSAAQVNVVPYGETKVTYTQPVSLTPGVTYYLQVMHPDGAPGNVVIYRGNYDDYQDGGAQINWDTGDFGQYDLNARIVSGP